MKRTIIEGITLINVHPESACKDQSNCVIHNPSDHHMRSFPLHWRADRGIFERICEHSIGHPDPDQFDYWEKTGQAAMTIHGCDGCCSPPDLYPCEDEIKTYQNAKFTMNSMIGESLELGSEEHLLAVKHLEIIERFESRYGQQYGE